MTCQKRDKRGGATTVYTLLTKRQGYRVGAVKLSENTYSNDELEAAI